MLWHLHSNSIPPVAHTVSLCTQNQFYHISYLSLTILHPLCTEVLKQLLEQSPVSYL
jgi:hypothetical protein